MDLSLTFQFSAASFLVDDASFTFEFLNGLYPILIRYLKRNFDQYASETSFIDLRSLIQSTTTIEMAVHKSCALIRLKFPHQITKEITNCHKSSYYMKNVQLSISTHLHVHFTRLSTQSTFLHLKTKQKYFVLYFSFGICPDWQIVASVACVLSYMPFYCLRGRQ